MSGNPYSGSFFTSCLQKGSEALGGVGARGCPLPLADSALQPPHQVALWIAAQP